MDLTLYKIRNKLTETEQRTILQCILTAAMSRTDAFGMRPFGIALAGMLADKHPLLAIASVAVGGIGGEIGIMLKYILALLLYMLLSTIRPTRNKPIKAAYLGMSVFAAGLLGLLWIRVSIKNALLILPETIIAASLNLLFRSRKKVGSKAFFKTIIIFSAALCGVYGIKVPYIDVDLAMFVAIMFLLCICDVCGINAATVSGTVIGFIMFAGSGTAPIMAGMFAMSAMLAAILSKMGRLGTVAGFLCGMTVAVLYLGSLSGMSAADIFLAPLLFAVLPDGNFYKIGKYMEKVFDNGASNDSKIIADRLKTVARAVCDLGDGVQVFSEIVPEDNDGQMFDAVLERTCGGCRYFGSCFDEQEMYYNMKELKKTIDRYGYLDMENVPVNIQSICINPEKFLNEFSHKYEMQKQDAVYDGETAEDRSIIVKQFGEISNVIASLSEQLRNADSRDDEQMFYVNVTVGQEAKQGQSVSGDAIVHFQKNDKYYVILCDGMGYGDSANRESSLTARLFEEFLSAGIEKKSAVNMINSALALKADRESFSTVDILEIDLKTGDAEFLKIGSAQSYIKRDDEIKTVFSTALPIGILENVEVKPQKTELENGDKILMLSDGIGEAGNGVLKNEWIKKTMLSEKDDRELSKKIISGAKARMQDDDMTSVVITIKEAI